LRRRAIRWREENYVITLNRNTVLSNTAQHGGGIDLSGSDARFNGNVIASNATEKGGGSHFSTHSDGTFTNTVVVDNQANSAGSGLYIAASSPCLLHTTLARNTVTLQAMLWGTATWSNGTDWGGAGTLVTGAGTLVTGTTNLWGNPGFVDPGTGDYHIGAGSAAIDAGVDAGVGVDIDGEHRPQGEGTDLGADEFTVIPAPGVPVLLAPPNGAVTTTRHITFAWTAEVGETADGYNLELDGDVITTTASMSATVLSYGVHTWTVQAYNVTGPSGWAEPSTVQVSPHRVHLPLVLGSP
jgi:hypothetical protein